MHLVLVGININQNQMKMLKKNKCILFFLGAMMVSISSYGAAPSITLATGSDSFNEVKVIFSEAVDSATGGNASNYKLSGGLTISGANVEAAPNDNTVILQTSQQSVGTEYTVTVNNVQDLSGNAIEVGSTMEFSSFIWQE